MESLRRLRGPHQPRRRPEFPGHRRGPRAAVAPVAKMSESWLVKFPSPNPILQIANEMALTLTATPDYWAAPAGTSRVTLVPKRERRTSSNYPPLAKTTAFWIRSRRFGFGFMMNVLNDVGNPHYSLQTIDIVRGTLAKVSCSWILIYNISINLTWV